MNRTKITLIAIGGVTALLALVFLYLIWDAYSAKTEKSDDLEAAVSDAERLVRLPVYPAPAGVKATEANRDAYRAWREEALKLASAGDQCLEKTTPPAFKQFLVDDARRLSELPGGADGRLVKPGFEFGFKDYITGGVLPQQQDLARLQREWNDISTVVGILADSAVSQVTDVELKGALTGAAAPDEDTGRKKKRQKKQKKDEEAGETGPAVTTFTIGYLARPSAFTAVVNALAVHQRFITVDDFSFVRETDALAEKLGGEVKAEAQAGGRRRRGRGQAAAPVKKEGEGEKNKGLVTDPLRSPLLKVKMTLSVYDFRSLDRDLLEKDKEAK